MVLRASAAIPMGMRKRIYTSVLGAGVLLGLAWGVGLSYARVVQGGTYREPVSGAGFPALAFIVVAVLGLLWLRPQPLLYALGLVSLLLAFGGPWLAVSEILRPWTLRLWGTGGYELEYLSLLFPVAWLLLAASVGAGKLGLLAYPLAGLTLILFIVAGGLLAPPPPSGRAISSLWDLLPSRYMLPCMWLLWPYYVLRFLSAYVWLPPCGE